MDSGKVLYEELRPDEFIRRVSGFPVAYLPLGTLEWHGLHLPLGADGLQAQGVFRLIAREAGGVVLPMLFLGPDSTVRHEGGDYYGMDHISFEEGKPQKLAGSAYYIQEERFVLLLDTVLRNLSRAGFKAVVAHGHGPSIKAFADRKGVFKEQTGLECFTLFDLGLRGADGIQTDHAAANETSLVMALRPELVEMEQLPMDRTPVGVWGDDPRRHASAERGGEVIRKNVDLAVEKLKEIMAGLPKGEIKPEYRNVMKLVK